MPKSGESLSSSQQSVLAKSEDGTIQITFTIPYTDIQKTEGECLSEINKEVEIPGFRKGFAPLAKVKTAIAQKVLLEKTLSKIIPQLLSEAIEIHKIKPAIYPKFELVRAKENENWQIRAITCEIPEVVLGDYEKEIIDRGKVSAIWTPKEAKDKESGKANRQMSREEKEQKLIKILLDAIKLKIPKLLIDEETNSRLSKLLERLEKLGLSLDSYLTSINKTPQSLRSEYEKEASDTISLDLILTEIARTKNLQVGPEEVDAAVKAASASESLQKEFENPQRRKFIEAILRRRKALDSIVSLI